MTVYEDLNVEGMEQLVIAMSYMQKSIDRLMDNTIPRVQLKRMVLDAYRILSDIDGNAASSVGTRLSSKFGSGGLFGDGDLDEAECDKIYERVKSKGIVDLFQKAYKLNPVFARLLLNKYAKAGVDEKYAMPRDTKFYKTIGRDLGRVPNNDETLQAIKKEVESWKG